MKYPKSYQELVKHFSTEDRCFDYLSAIRWVNGFVCSNCDGKKFWKSSQRQYICVACKKKSRVLAGTLFQDTKLPLNLWFQMIWWFVGPKNGASALALMQNFGIGSYRTSWKLLTKLRSCTVFPLREPLSGEVEVDEAFLGGKRNKEIIAVATEKRGKATGRIRLKHIKSRKRAEIQGFITKTISLEQRSSLIGIKAILPSLRKDIFTILRRNHISGKKLTVMMIGCYQEYIELSPC